MSYETIDVDVQDATAIVKLARPKALNALNAQMVGELGAALAALAEQELKALVLTGAGMRAFAAGADIKEMAGFSALEAEAMAQRGQRLLGRLESFPAPTIAAVNGFALGGGCELAMCCDLIVAGPNAVFGQPEVKLGVIPGFGGTQRLVRRVGRQRALELMMTGRTVGAEEAVALGIALSIAEEDAMDEALALAARIGANGPAAVRLVKRAVHETDSLGLEAGLAAEASLFALCFATEDQTEGMAAFLERRASAFTGR
ncbi:MAG: enoyl-CoA hydratase-related protein [Myxococcota bacterium]|nr:enoyl-CoA hydratase-related protein [Myxococcota bacterium]